MKSLFRKKIYDGFIMTRLMTFYPHQLFGLRGDNSNAVVGLIFVHTWLEDQDKKKDRDVGSMKKAMEKANGIINELKSKQ